MWSIAKDQTTSTEFYVPKRGLTLRPYLDAEEKQGIHHLGRYHWASSIAGSRRTMLDIACGAGFGAKIYADSHPRAVVLGVDYDERAVAHARAHHVAPNLSYRVGDLTTWCCDAGNPLGQFDFISCFDTLEHLLHREIALINLTENLADDGMLCLSTPVKSKNRLNPAWEHHKIEYAAHDLLNLLERFFRNVLISDDGTLPNQAFWDDVINQGTVRYLNRVNPVVCLGPMKRRPGRADRHGHHKRLGR